MKDKAKKSNSPKGKITRSPANKDKKAKKLESDRETMGVDDKLLGDDLEIRKAGEVKEDKCADPETKENNY